MSSLLIKNAHVIPPDVEKFNAAVFAEDGVIKQVIDAGNPLPKADKVVDIKGKMLVPGFIDLHIHGGMGYEATSDKKEAVKVIAEAKIKEGVTSFCPTTLTLPENKLAASLKNIEAYRKKPTGAKVIGTHLEGPYINPDCIGAQNPAYLRKPDFDEIKRLDAISKVSIVTYAIETEGAVPFTAKLVKAGIVPSCGHTAATMEQYKAGQAKGLCRLTHFCNQMTKLHHREIGMVGAGFLIDDLDTEVICDRIHLCDDMLRLIFSKRPLAHIQMITDSLRCSHLPDGYAFEMGGLKVQLKGGEARLVEGGNLAGSTLWMNKGLKNIHEVTGLPLKDIIRVTSWNQAIGLGLGKQLGKIERGFVAALAVLDPKTFDVSAVFLDGELRTRE